jgi:hypothetical protein
VLVDEHHAHRAQSLLSDLCGNRIGRRALLIGVQSASLDEVRRADALVGGVALFLAHAAPL